MIKTIVSFKKAIAKVAFKKAIAKVAFKKAIAEIEFGHFPLIRIFLDSLGLSDTESKILNKSLSDSQEISDSTITALNKPESDQADLTDSSLVNFASLQSDSGQTSDAIDNFAISKSLQDSSAFSEVQNMNFHKFVQEATGVTDDLDGEATADDDQEMTFVKVRSDLATMTDILNIVKSKILADGSALADSGSLRSQGYCDFSYFEADYVGNSRNF